MPHPPKLYAQPESYLFNLEATRQNTTQSYMLDIKAICLSPGAICSTSELYARPSGYMPHPLGHMLNQRAICSTCRLYASPPELYAQPASYMLNMKAICLTPILETRQPNQCTSNAKVTAAREKPIKPIVPNQHMLPARENQKNTKNQS